MFKAARDTTIPVLKFYYRYFKIIYFITHFIRNNFFLQDKEILTIPFIEKQFKHIVV